MFWKSRPKSVTEPVTTKSVIPLWTDGATQYRYTLDLSVHGVVTILAALDSVKHDGIEDTTPLIAIIQEQMAKADSEL